jgi:hypothetical protein
MWSLHQCVQIAMRVLTNEICSVDERVRYDFSSCVDTMGEIASCVFMIHNKGMKGKYIELSIKEVQQLLDVDQSPLRCQQ